MDVANLPPELQAMFAGAQVAKETNKFGPNVWDRIWPHRCPTKPNAKGERTVRPFDWSLEAGEVDARCVIAQLPTQILVHNVNFGWKEHKGKTFFMREKVRCTARTWAFDKKLSVWKLEGTGTACPFCKILGETRFKLIQVGGVVDIRVQRGEALRDEAGQVIDNPPRMLLLESDASQQAISAGIRERVIRGRPAIGTIFVVSRGSDQNSARVGTTWLPDLDHDVPEAEIKKIYFPVDMNYAFPLLDGKAKNQFDHKEVETITHAIIERHIFMCIKHKDSFKGNFVGFDEYAAQEAGYNLDALAEQGEEDKEPEEPTTKGLKLAISNLSTLTAPAQAPPVQTTTNTRPALTELKDKPVETPPEEEIDPKDIVDYKREQLNELAKDWGIPSDPSATDDAVRTILLVSPSGFELSLEEANGVMGVMEPAAEAPEAEEEAPEEAPEAKVDIEAVAKKLLDKTTPIAVVTEAAKYYGVEPAVNDKKQILRSATVERIVAKASGKGGKDKPWEA